MHAIIVHRFEAFGPVPAATNVYLRTVPDEGLRFGRGSGRGKDRPNALSFPAFKAESHPANRVSVKHGQLDLKIPELPSQTVALALRHFGQGPLRLYRRGEFMHDVAGQSGRTLRLSQQDVASSVFIGRPEDRNPVVSVIADPEGILTARIKRLYRTEGEPAAKIEAQRLLIHAGALDPALLDRGQPASASGADAESTVVDEGKTRVAARRPFSR